MKERGAARALTVTCPDGVRVQVWTEGQGRPLMVLHGFGLDGLAYRSALREFAKQGFQVFAPTTNVPLGGRWSLGGLARRVNAICEALGTRALPIIGHSFGGVVGARLALDYPGRVSSFVAVNAALLSPGGWELTKLALPGPHYRLAADRRLIASFARASRSRGAFRNLAGSVRWMLSTDLESELPRLRARALPSAVLWARDAFLPEHVGRDSAALMGARFVPIGPQQQPDASFDHVWPLRRASMFVDSVVNVIDDLERQPQAAE